jgi:Peptidase family M41
MNSKSERNTAIHEAGHAVAAFCVRQNVRKASIIPKMDTLGRVTHSPLKFADNGMFDDSLRGGDRAEKRIVICYAGPLASRKFQPRCRWRIGGSGDFDTAMVLMAHLQGPDFKYNNLYSKLLWRRAELLVDSRWREINAVADALIEHRRLDSKAIEAVIFSELAKSKKGASK